MAADDSKTNISLPTKNYDPIKQASYHTDEMPTTILLVPSKYATVGQLFHQCVLILILRDVFSSTAMTWVAIGVTR